MLRLRYRLVPVCNARAGARPHVMPGSLYIPVESSLLSSFFFIFGFLYLDLPILPELPARRVMPLYDY
jgi:hypothetical protein